MLRIGAFSSGAKSRHRYTKRESKNPLELDSAFFGDRLTEKDKPDNFSYPSDRRTNVGSHGLVKVNEPVACYSAKNMWNMKISINNNWFLRKENRSIGDGYLPL